MRARGRFKAHVAAATAVVLLASCGSASKAEDSPPPVAPTFAKRSPANASPDTPTPVASPEPNWIPDSFAAEFEAKAAELGATAAIGLADFSGGPPYQAGTVTTPYAYSTIKVPMAATLLNLAGESANGANIWWALASSDNAAARAIYNDLVAITGSEAAATNEIEAMLARAGDSSTAVPTAEEIPNWPQRQAAGVLSTYGQTLWQPGPQAQFVAQLLRGCLLSAESTATLTTAMTQVVPAQDWGMGALPQVDAFKGGWGQDDSGYNYYVRQVGRVTTEPGRPYVMALTLQLWRPSAIAGGSLSPETATLDALAAWTVSRLGPPPTPTPCE